MTQTTKGGVKPQSDKNHFFWNLPLTKTGGIMLKVEHKSVSLYILSEINLFYWKMTYNKTMNSRLWHKHKVIYFRFYFSVWRYNALQCNGKLSENKNIFRFLFHCKIFWKSNENKLNLDKQSIQFSSHYGLHHGIESLS